MDRFGGRRRLVLLAVGALAAFSLGSARAATTTVIERGTSYIPKQVDIAPGDTVIWTFESGPPGSARHTVTFDDGTDLNPGCPGGLLLNDCQDSPGETVQRRFTTSGTYPYHCKIHSGMVGVVVVAPAGGTTSTASASSTSSTLPRATTTSSTVRASTSSTTATTRPLATSSTLASSSTTSTTMDTSSVLLPGDPPPFSGEDANSAAGQSGGSDDGSDSRTVALIVALLLAVSVGGGYLLWRLRPGRA